MSNFNINEEVDKICTKLSVQIKAAIARREKQFLKEYIAAQKDTSKSPKTSKSTKTSAPTSTGKKASPARRGPPKREKEYASTDSEDSD